MYRNCLNCKHDLRSVFRKCTFKIPYIDFARFEFPPESFLEFLCSLQNTLPLVCERHCSYHWQMSYKKNKLRNGIS